MNKQRCIKYTTNVALPTIIKFIQYQFSAVFTIQNALFPLSFENTKLNY